MQMRAVYPAASATAARARADALEGDRRLSNAALLARILWRDVLRQDPGDPRWLNRDRFVLAHHEAPALQCLLVEALPGWEPSLHAAEHAPKHDSEYEPEHDPEHDPEHELARALGLATAEAVLRRHFNRPGHDVVEHFTYVLADPTTLSRPAARDLCDRAARAGLHKLIVLCVHAPDRLPPGWHVIRDVPADQPLAVVSAVRRAHSNSERPTLIACRSADTLQRWDSVASASSEAHEHGAGGACLSAAWCETLRRYTAQHPSLAAELQRRDRGRLPLEWSLSFAALLQSVAQRSQRGGEERPASATLARLRWLLPELIDISDDVASAAGMAGHGGLLPFAVLDAPGFEANLNTIRRTAAMQRRAIFVIAQRAQPPGCNCTVLRRLHDVAQLEVWQPADEFELAWAWRAAAERRGGSSALLLPRALRFPERNIFGDADPSRGAYVFAESSGRLQASVLASGPHLHSALSAQRLLQARGIGTRVVSVPCRSAFARQSLHYQARTLPHEIPRVFAHSVAGRCLEGCTAAAGEYREPRATAQALVDAVTARVVDAPPPRPRQSLSREERA